ncbi:BioD-like N-terminal domain of phosphotransacetylase [Prochlorococcus marinus str. MIT 9515]|uniref:BioD-like N-terminal domain of phosphotransacetylase n=1 Tax=Prochlorococcus marinus (strain MIT 9515) TaxID=167542 RepID=A2BVE0_PROM5|nr:phosphotransacetylase family protein [Prochlorococcus marinus]ABM71751.1 BioD-like N-terminal domain of phosphotransacetylase [Prochlorococcus marinus str. MIT 9515]
MSQILLIGSCEPFSGKSALVLGISKKLIEEGKKIRIGKPLATCTELTNLPAMTYEGLIDDDVKFIGSTLNIVEENLIPSVGLLDNISAEKRIANQDLSPGKGFKQIEALVNDNFDGLNILEAAGSLNEGMIYGLSLPQLAKQLNAKVLIVNLWEDSKSVDALLDAKQQLGDHFVGAVLNAVVPEEVEKIKNIIIPSLQEMNMKIFGVMPKSPLLRSVTVGELINRLDAQVICCPEKEQLLVETLSIGAMGVNSAMEFFRRRRNMAVVTGADRTDIQLAALEASTQCLILTGLGEPLSQIIHRAEELEVPILKVELDTLASVEIIEQAFGHVRIHESIKASYAVQLVQQHVNLQNIFETIDFPCNISDQC